MICRISSFAIFPFHTHGTPQGFGTPSFPILPRITQLAIRLVVGLYWVATPNAFKKSIADLIALIAGSNTDMPGLYIGALWRPSSQLKNLIDQLVRHQA